MTVLNILLALLLLTLLVVVHEYGHYIVGRIFGFTILEFAVGMGPKIVSWEKKGILYSIRAFPIGGFNKFYGEDEDLDDEKTFNKHPVGHRALVIAAGPIMNILFAFILAIIILCTFGDVVPVVKGVTAGGPAEEAGVMPDDEIIAINGNKIDFGMEFDMAVENLGDQVTLTVLRDGEEIDLVMNTVFDESQDKNIIGISVIGEGKTFSILEGFALSFKWLFLIIKQMIIALGLLIFKGQGLSDTAGPVGTIVLISNYIKYGTETILRLAALLSINLGIINLLPFPALDGGRLVFLGIEKIRKKPLPNNIEGYANFVGFVILIVLILLLTYKDILGVIE
ncbi:MAG: M50 family metallopeptidase [Eubacteriales bacterium]